MASRLLTAVTALLLAFAPAHLRAQNIAMTSQEAFAKGDASISFRFDEVQIVPDYMDNASQLARLADCIAKFRMNIDSVTIIAFSSPEGRYGYNQTLSEKRARAMKQYLLKNWPGVKFGKIREFAGGPDFKGLAAALEGDTGIPYRNEVMAIVRSWGRKPETSFRRLMTLREGEPYSYIQQKYLPMLRNATTVIFHYDSTVSLYKQSDPQTSTAVSFESQATGNMVTSAPSGLTSVLPSGSTSSFSGSVVSVYVPPTSAASYDSGVLPPEVIDGSNAASAVIPVTSKYIVEDPVVRSAETKRQEPPTRQDPPAPAKQEIQTVQEPPARQQEPPKQESPTRQEIQARRQEAAQARRQEALARRQAAQARQQETQTKPEPPARQEPRPVQPYTKEKTVAAISTNLLYDAATAANISVEFPMDEKFTMKIEGIFPWWSWNNNVNTFRINHINLGARYWFNEPMSRGWYAGAALGAGRYDILPRDFGWRGWEGMLTVGGGYAVPLSRRFVLDFGLGLGAMYTKFDRYEKTDDGIRAMTQTDRKFLYFGPTDLRISIVYLFKRPAF